MADHNTLIGSTTGEIEGGTVLIGGVLGEIDSGLVLAGGVAREIEFGSDECVITLSGSGTPTYIASVAIAGKTYYINSVASNPQIVVPSGTVITLKTQSTSSGAASYIKINGSTVYTGNGTTRTFTVTKNTRIKLGTATKNNSTGGTIEITEE